MAMFDLDRLITDLFKTTVLPGIAIGLWLTDLIGRCTCAVAVLLFLVGFVILPIIFKYSYALQKSILFLTFITYPPNLDLKRPEKSGLYATRNFYVNHHDHEEDLEVNVAVWHVLPLDLVRRYAKELHVDERTIANKTLPTIDGITSNGGSIVADEKHHAGDRYKGIEKVLRSDGFQLTDEKHQRDLFEETLRATTNDVVLYLHGNTASRGAPHRVELYQMLRALNYHVIAIDYRGYGDSANLSPSELGVVYDALAVYQYITSITNNPVYLWGHSLGTGVSTHLLSLLTEMSLPGPKAVVLESPFNNIKEEICAHPFSKLYRHLPWFDYLISRPMYKNKLRFESDQHIAEFRQPVLILHAEDDLVVPFELGYKLYRKALDMRGKSWGPIEFHRFEKSSHYGHKYICRAPNLPEIIVRFFHAYRDAQY
ncbi:lysophosphatidylserine lipase ABHD12 isoform X4 [Anopheles gambiae]|uniref:lysophosphatidylserine lipase ABHD12 isoform X4 n=1 Tax=Anopheles gambiae TaxID=7165 RepID=UPI002AC93296|nr:lysophosphatidylserine lipase ABHD12 isoform X4 [Anopheles gambiae]